MVEASTHCPYSARTVDHSGDIGLYNCVIGGLVGKPPCPGADPGGPRSGPPPPLGGTRGVSRTGLRGGPKVANVK